MDAFVNVTNLSEGQWQFFIVLDSAQPEIRKEESELEGEELTNFQNLVQLIRSTKSSQFVIKNIADIEDKRLIDFSFNLVDFKNVSFFSCELSQLTEEQQEICNTFFNQYID